MNRPPISTQQSEQPSPTANMTTRNSATGTIACTICQAVYAPSRSHISLQQAHPIALESAFMSMCHFCFRCRRPACPNCWDDIHGICAQCAQEMHIPFRVETTPLKGTSPLASQPVPATQERSTPPPLMPSLISVRPGRFQESSPPSSSANSTIAHSEHATAQQAAKSGDTVIKSSSPLDIDRIATRPDRTGVFDIDKVTTQPDRKHRNADTQKTRPQRSQNTKQHPARLLITTILLILILSVLILIAAAQLSPDANLFISNTLHIDIHATLSNLWHFLQNIF